MKSPAFPEVKSSSLNEWLKSLPEGEKLEVLKNDNGLTVLMATGKFEMYVVEDIVEVKHESHPMLITQQDVLEFWRWR